MTTLSFYTLCETTASVRSCSILGPDAFFWVGIEGNPKIVPTDDKTLILDPKGTYFQYRDAKAPILGKYEGETVTLKMPANMKVGDLKWISVWCRKFSVDFGHVIIDEKDNGE